LVGRRAARAIEGARAVGLQVNVWTVNRRSSIARLARLGVDGIVTDVPDVARAVLNSAAGP
jgi:glycerophosphoryl diester phosphodiesterase